MTSILLVDDDETFRAALRRELEGLGFDVRSAESVDEALALLTRFVPDVVLTDLRMSARDGIDLLGELRQLLPGTLPILMSAFATARDHQAAISLGAVRVLNKPFTPDDLQEAIAQALESRTGFRGSVHGLSLIDLLQMFHFGKRSITIDVAGQRPGSIHIADGQIVHATQAELSGEAALAALLRSDTGSIQTRPALAVERSVHASFDSLLLDVLRQNDESQEIEVDELDLDASDFLGIEAGTDPVSMPRAEGGDMGKIDDACKDIVGKVDGAVACGVVDLDTGMLLGIHNAAQYTQTLNEVVAAATMDMFRGANVGRIEQMVRQHRGIPEDGGHYFEEIHVTSRNNFHFMKTIKGGKAVIVLITKKTTNIGMGWAQVKSVIPQVEPHVP
ncbi:MAG: response regulator [Myxococcales bacterium]|nr:response regulator [Myxococcales bacterium]